jgi:hypothetical protein
MDRPWQRKPTEFRHPNLSVWALENRAELVRAILTLGRAWFARGRPKHAERLGSFEEWSEVTGGILKVAGIDGFLRNQNSLYEAADVEGQAWRELICAWKERFPEEAQKVSTLWKICDELELMANIRGSGSEKSQHTRLGNALQRQRGRVFDGVEIVLTDDRKSHGRFYRLQNSKNEPKIPTNPTLETEARSPKGSQLDFNEVPVSSNDPGNLANLDDHLTGPKKIIREGYAEDQYCVRNPIEEKVTQVIQSNLRPQGNDEISGEPADFPRSPEVPGRIEGAI